MKFLFAVSMLFTAGLGAQVPSAYKLPEADNRISRNAACVADGVLYLGGEFTQMGGQERAHLAAIDLASGALLPWDPGVDGGEVVAILVKDGRVYLGGTFKSVSGKPRPYLAAVGAARAKSAGLLLDWDPASDGPVGALSSGPKGTVFVAGKFSHIGGQDRSRLAQLTDAAHGAARATEFDAKADQRVNTLVWDASLPGQLFVAGFFSHCGGEERGLAATLDAFTGKALPASAGIEGTQGKEVLRAILFRGGYYCVGVEIGHVGGLPRSNAFALDPKGLKALPWKADLNAGAGALTALGDHIYVGGDFLKANGHERRLAAFHWKTGELASWDPLPDNNTYAVAAWMGGVAASGYWKKINGQPSSFLVSLPLVEGDAAADKALERARTEKDGEAEIHYTLPLGKDLIAGPNPASDRIVVVFRMTATGTARLALSDISGQEVVSQDLGSKPAGIQGVPMNLKNLSSGIYVLSFLADEGSGLKPKAYFKVAIKK